MKGVSECVFRAPVGKATVICTFTDGNLQSREPIPATFTTENPIVQAVIESCELYASKKIFLMASYGEEAPVVETPKAVETPKPTKTKKADSKKGRVMEEVKTFGDAVTVLMKEGDIAASDLTDITSVVRKASELGISFPNLKSE